MNKVYSIAIDGPSASGKSTIAKLLAEKLNIGYLNTGKMYRCLAYFFRIDKINDEKYIQEFCQNIVIKAQKIDNEIEFSYNNITPNDKEIFSEKNSQKTSKISSLPSIRELMKEIQQRSSKNFSLVMEGRDICSNILPNAKYKFFITASPRTRAIRRLKQNKQELEESIIDNISKEISQRDERDSQRAHSPLRQSSDSILIDTSKMNIDESLNKVLININE